jgi:O-antigen/teichoic acid export membrane protein
MSEAIGLGEAEASVDQLKDASVPARVAGNPLDGCVPHDLKRRTARGALVSTFGQGASFVLRTVSMVILARLLAPADFGLVGMVMACTGFLGLVQDAGLSMATIQRAVITRAQTSTLFWINLVVGGMLAALCAAMAPLVAAFYHEPRVLWITVIFGACFIFSGAMAQHRALLQREMRFMLLNLIDITALCVSVGLGIAMAIAGYGYWALVGMTVCVPVVTLLGVLVAGGWIPGPPQRGAGVRSMLRYGGTVTLNGVVVYIAYNADKVLLGRFWGPDALGIYGRAYQLSNLPTANLNTAIGSVAVPALSRLQNDPKRLRSYFLKGYGLFLSLVLPITAGCALFADDIILVFLGPKWGEAVPVFRLLAPTILTFALINPLGWLMLATDRAGRSLRIALFLLPVVVVGYVVGLKYGSQGVAAGFSIATVLLAVPVIFWATHGTVITGLETLKVFMRPFLSVLIGIGVTLAAWNFVHLLSPPILRLIVANTILFGVYGFTLWYAMGQKDMYLGLIRDFGIWPFHGRRKETEAISPCLTKPQVSEQ